MKDVLSSHPCVGLGSCNQQDTGRVHFARPIATGLALQRSCWHVGSWRLAPRNWRWCVFLVSSGWAFQCETKEEALADEVLATSCTSCLLLNLCNLLPSLSFRMNKLKLWSEYIEQVSSQRAFNAKIVETRKKVPAFRRCWSSLPVLKEIFYRRILWSAMPNSSHQDTQHICYWSKSVLAETSSDVLHILLPRCQSKVTS